MSRNVVDESFAPTANLLFAHLEAHCASFHSFGFDVVLLYGCPRTVSLRSCPKKPSERGNFSAIANASGLSSIMRAFTQIKKYVQERVDNAMHSAPTASLDSTKLAGDGHFALAEITVSLEEQMRRRSDGGASDSRTFQGVDNPHEDASGTQPRTATREVAIPCAIEAGSGQDIADTTWAAADNCQPTSEKSSEALRSTLKLREQIQLYRDLKSVLDLIASATEQMPTATGVATSTTPKQVRARSAA
jgi:hypothetical protein